eukprot:Nitzschia sp. Nitz4//scaffold8_size234185//25292//37594//NITZ4_001234-RA/size234185-snap-gene-0.4-mRNA-1//1//CDS//3329559737//9478//frame0
MFERLVQRVLGQFLAKYFTEESLARNKIHNSAQLGVWSGYVALRNLELKKEIINDKIRRKGLPFELVHCSFRQVEITIPWAKLTNPMSSKSASKQNDTAVVVVVVDGVHVLVRTSFDFDDLALRKESLKKRRKALEKPFEDLQDDIQAPSYAEAMKKRLKEGIVQEIVEKLHIHLRDLHIRLEDVESDPQNPCACGITLESMHVQHDDDEDATEGFVAKMAQLNHLSLYWNALEYGDTSTVEHSVLHQMYDGDAAKLAECLDQCIPRRASVIASPSRHPYIPTHTYLLLPVDGTCRARLSTHPMDLSVGPAAQVLLTIDPVAAQIRDFQCIQILRLYGEYKNHKYFTKHRRFRPLVSVKEDARAWWQYAARAVRHQMRETFLRWSWSRFVGVYKTRGRYMELYERHLLYSDAKKVQKANGRAANSEMTNSDLVNQSRLLRRASTTTLDLLPLTNDATLEPEANGEHPSGAERSQTDRTRLTDDEYAELQGLDDGLVGDLSVSSILLFRAVVERRLGKTSSGDGRRGFWWSPAVEHAVGEDAEAHAEWEKLLSYLEKSTNGDRPVQQSLDKLAVSFTVRVEELRIGFFSPLSATKGQTQLRKLYHRFLEICIVDLRGSVSLKGDYESKEFQLSLFDLVGTEMRVDTSQHIMVKRKAVDDDNSSQKDGPQRKDPLMVVSMAQNAPKTTGCDIDLVVFIDTLEFTLSPDCEWIGLLKKTVKQIRRLPNLKDFWGGLSLAYFNSLALGRLGMATKAQSIVEEHKNIEAEITIQCPVIHIGDGNGNFLVIDLGIAHIGTEKLAGVAGATNSSLVAMDRESSRNRATDYIQVGRLEETSVLAPSGSGRLFPSSFALETPTNGRTRSDRQFTFSSALSVDSRLPGTVYRSMSGSQDLEDPMSRMNAADDLKSLEGNSWSALFYDVFFCRLLTGNISLARGEDENYNFVISRGIEVSTSIRKSVLPADHTLCKMKTHTDVPSLVFELNEHVIAVVADAAKAWKSLLKSDRDNTTEEWREPPELTFDVTTPFPPFEDTSIGQSDDEEFFDAKDMHDSFAGDNPVSWFAENWISDAESLLDGDNRSHGPRSRQRRTASISDVSSASDQSTKDSSTESSAKVTRKHHGNAYLSAENLARLEEGAGEDDSLPESAKESEDDSFHSVMSAAGQQQVVRDLELDISKCSERIEELAMKLRTDLPEFVSQREGLRLELRRARAEYQGLKALHSDLERLFLETPSQAGVHGDNVEKLLQARLNEQARKAKSLLLAKRKRDSLLDANSTHNLTKNLNPELFQGSILFHDIRFIVHVPQTSSDTTEQNGDESLTFEFIAEQTGIATVRHLQDSKVFFSLDQVSLSLRSTTLTSSQTTLLLTGGSSDTLLPSHFPHLISRSMEDKLIRGSVNFGKLHNSDDPSRHATCKARLVIGDIEFFPAKKLLVPFYRMLTTTKAVQVSRGPSTGQTPSPKMPTESLNKSSFLDLAVRVTSIRLALANQNHITGAAVATETTVRAISLASPYRNKVQLDLRSTNLQLIEITSMETGQGSEVFGRRDPYSALLQMRVRTQLVRPNEISGWVVGNDREVNLQQLIPTDAVRNIHMGLRINPVAVVADVSAISNFLASSNEVKGVFKSKTDMVPGKEGKENKVAKWYNKVSKSHPLRWRFDVSLKRIAVTFPEKRVSGTLNFAEELTSKMSTGFSVVACIQQSKMPTIGFSLRAAVTDFSIVRSADDWPVLEPCTLVFDMFFESPSLAHILENRLSDTTKFESQLRVLTGSPLDEISAVCRQLGWTDTDIEHMSTLAISLNAKFSATKLNISAPIIALGLEIVNSLKGLATKEKHKRKSDSAEKGDRRDRRIRIVVQQDEFELQCFREADSKPISHAKPRLALGMSGFCIDFERTELLKTSVTIRNMALYDLSSSRGIRVIGCTSDEPSDEDPDFAKILLVKSSDLAMDNVSLTINWGNIQCLAIPSFLQSILSLKDEIQSVVKATKKEASISKSDSAVLKLASYPRDVNLNIAVHASSFECILSSKDIPDYIRQGGIDPIGVVTLRWKSSLDLSIALDKLLGETEPWVSMNRNSFFTDVNDIGLFKDFVTRYLSQSSLAGSAEIGQQLVNAFTTRLQLSVSGFQVIRTNISSHSLKRRKVTPSYESAHRICFTVLPPEVGEQRVTNSITLDISYRAVGATMTEVVDVIPFSPQVEISQLIEFKAKYVDLLLYISQSEGGFTESYRATIRPIVDILKKKDKRRKPEPEQAFDISVDCQSDAGRSVFDIMKSASSLCTIQLEGFQVTCVPGGATRLNESPIAKIELVNFASGFAVCAVPALPARYSSGHGMRSRRNSKTLLTCGDLAYPTIGGWVVCEVSGHYHNRRLVAWEPFLEPWTVNLRLGIDTVQMFKVAPAVLMSKQVLRSPSEQATNGTEPLASSLTSTEGRSDRLRDFGRLFRTQFQNTLSTKQTSSNHIFISHPDFCFLMLASSCRSTIISALCPSAESSREQESRLFARLPTREANDWLRSFGFPGRDSDSQVALSCVLSDSTPLNINLTGALLENVLGYMQSVKSRDFRTVAPHWIRNETGMTLRFQEVLDPERLRRGEEYGKVTVLDGAEVPLTLRRSLSQTCDPHRAYIYLELGSFEDTVGRIKHDEFDIPKGALSTSFFFKAAAKIPVDTVGVHRYPLDRNIDTRSEGIVSASNSRALGWIIVRVALKDGVKIVSVESPFVLKSTADNDLLCEIREHNGLSLLWRCLVPRSSPHTTGTVQKDTLVSVPADIVPFLHHESYTFSLVALPVTSDLHHEADLISSAKEKAIDIRTPPPFSPQSYGKGLIREDEVSLSTFDPNGQDNGSDNVHLTVCSFRIGSLSSVSASVEVPEQRMIVFRSPLAIRNCLALPIAVQVRLKVPGQLERQNSSKGLNRLYTSLAEWEDLGVLDCGEFVHWTGAKSSEKVQMRVRFVGTDGDNSRRFPGWSTPVYIPAFDKSPKQSSRMRQSGSSPFARMRVLDAENVPLHLSLSFDAGQDAGIGDTRSTHEDIRTLSQSLSEGTRAVSVYVPYWIVDSTNQDLEFYSGSSVAGQLDKFIEFENGSNMKARSGSSLGLAELLDNESFLNIPSNRSFEVMMVGDESATRLTVRKRVERRTRNSLRRMTSPWSDPIPIQTDGGSRHDITVLAPKSSTEDQLSTGDDIRGYDRFVLQSNVVPAPERFGGLLGTKLVHVVNRYSILNETGRDMEISTGSTNASVVLVRATGVPQPFHFDDSRPIRLRFKEFGWAWSGKFNIRHNRPEVTMRLRHQMKGLTIIVTAELLARKKSSTNVIVLRQSSHPPFRVENHTMVPLRFGQSLTMIGSEDPNIDTMLLPYQISPFAWDEPELRRRILVAKTSDAPGQPGGHTLGRFQLEKIAPGGRTSLDSSIFTAEVVADGPTRVLRITDASMPSLSTTRQDDISNFQQHNEELASLTMSISAKFSHGIGISVVDWSPRELVYARLEDIHIERKLDQKVDEVNVSIGHIKLNNQLLVTPYPILLKMGRRTVLQQTMRRRHRRHDAISLRWRRSLDDVGYGNLTLLERVELSLEPVIVSVDGHLANLLLRMAHQTAGVSGGARMLMHRTRDDELRHLLNLGEDVFDTPNISKLSRGNLHHTSDGDLMTTAAIAAKLRTEPLPFVKVPSSTSRPFRSASARRPQNTELTKPSHKFYVEKLRISAAKADLSWTGPLPGLVSSRLLRALTFERLPVRLQPYSTVHVYGSVKDHVQSMKSHYVSFWRILDLVFGICSTPTFLFRAVAHTSRETCISLLDSCATDAKDGAKLLTDFVSKGPAVVASPVYDDGHEPAELPKSWRLGKMLLSPFARSGAMLLGTVSSLASISSAVLTFGSKGSKHNSSRGLVRSRNPRLFARVDGKELLVEYLEGENAGKALLSRVRMGVLLGEGYIYHCEGARQRKAKPRFVHELDPTPFIVMVTTERTMMLNGKLDWNFCSVVWEVAFPNIVQVEVIPADELSLTKSFDEVILWYLRDGLFAEGNLDDKGGAAYVKTNWAGMDVLHSMNIFLPPRAGEQLASKLGDIDRRLAKHISREMTT